MIVKPIYPSIYCFCLFIIMTSCNNNAKESAEMSFETIDVAYPETYQDSSVVENYHGNTVKDPYRWLEDDNSEDMFYNMNEEINFPVKN